MKNEEGIITQDQYSEDSIFSLLCGHSTQYAKKLICLLHHHDTEVKEQVAKIITQLRGDTKTKYSGKLQ